MVVNRRLFSTSCGSTPVKSNHPYVTGSAITRSISPSLGIRGKEFLLSSASLFSDFPLPAPAPETAVTQAMALWVVAILVPRARRCLVTWLETGRLQIKPSDSGDENGSWLTEVALYFPMDKTRRLPSNSENKPLNVY